MQTAENNSICLEDRYLMKMISAPFSSLLASMTVKDSKKSLSLNTSKVVKVTMSILMQVQNRATQSVLTREKSFNS